LVQEIKCYPDSIKFGIMLNEMASTELLNLRFLYFFGPKMNKIDHNIGINNFSIVYLVAVPIFFKFKVPSFWAIVHEQIILFEIFFVRIFFQHNLITT